MQVGKLGFIGEQPKVKIAPLDDQHTMLAIWCEKRAKQYENHSRKYLKIAELLREQGGQK